MNIIIERPSLSFTCNNHIYTFDVKKLDEPLDAVPGIYIFTIRTETTDGFSHSYVYADVSDNLQEIPKEIYDLATSKGANCICLSRWGYLNKHEKESGLKDVKEFFS